MCRWLAFYGDPQYPDNRICAKMIVYDPPHSIFKHQVTKRSPPSDHSDPTSSDPNTPINIHGWGLGWWQGHSLTPTVFVRAHRPDKDDEEKRVIQKSERVNSHCIFAHIRQGDDREGCNPHFRKENCHPFRFGKLLFMHNGGTLKWSSLEFKREIRKLIQGLNSEVLKAVKGKTDSEHIAALFVGHLAKRDPGRPKKKWQTMENTPDELRQALSATIEDLQNTILRYGGYNDQKREYSSWNFCISDGATLLASRYAYPAWRTPPNLFYNRPTLETKEKQARIDTPHPVIVASEPFDDPIGKDWVKFGKNTLLVVKFADLMEEKLKFESPAWEPKFSPAVRERRNVGVRRIRKVRPAGDTGHRFAAFI